MSRKSKRNKAGQKIISTRDRRGNSRTADLSIKPEQRGQLRELSGVAAHITQECYELAMRFEHIFETHNVRMVAVDAFLETLVEYLRGGDVSERQLVTHVNNTVIKPVGELCQKIVDLLAEQQRREDSLTRQLARDQADAHSANYFTLMLTAFENLVRVLINLNQEDQELRNGIQAALTVTNRCAAEGEKICQRIVGASSVQKSSPIGIEQELNDLLRRTSRELQSAAGPLHDKQSLERRWEELERLRRDYRQTLAELAAVQEQYRAAAQRFYREHDNIGLYTGEWTRQATAIRLALEFFDAAGVDPFALSDQLAGIARAELLTMPDEAARAELDQQGPDTFPELPPSKIVERADTLINELTQALTACEAKAPAQAKGRRAPQPPPSCPIKLEELALCAYAALVEPGTTKGKRQLSQASGYTVSDLYTKLLMAEGFTYGFSQEDFAAAVQEAVEVRLLRRFKWRTPSGQNWYWRFQPTPTGLAWIELSKLFEQLPADFRERIFARHEALCRAAV